MDDGDHFALALTQSCLTSGFNVVVGRYVVFFVIVAVEVILGYNLVAGAARLRHTQERLHAAVSHPSCAAFVLVLSDGDDRAFLSNLFGVALNAKQPVLVAPHSTHASKGDPSLAYKYFAAQEASVAAEGRLVAGALTAPGLRANPTSNAAPSRLWTGSTATRRTPTRTCLTPCSGSACAAARSLFFYTVFARGPPLTNHGHRVEADLHDLTHGRLRPPPFELGPATNALVPAVAALGEEDEEEDSKAPGTLDDALAAAAAANDTGTSAAETTMEMEMAAVTLAETETVETTGEAPEVLEVAMEGETAEVATVDMAEA